MAFYNPPGAPAQGGLTVDASRYQNLQAPQYQPVPNPFAKAYELKKQAMEMKRAERIETEAISGEVLAKMQNDIFSMGQDSSVFNPDNILQGGVFRADELQKRRFTTTLKTAAWGKYQKDAKVAGGVANRLSFEEVWNKAKEGEDAKILNEMWLDVSAERMTEKDFNLAVRNPAFRNYFKDLSRDSKENIQKELEAAEWKRYAPGYLTPGLFGEKTWGRKPDPTTGEIDPRDVLTSPGALGTVGIGSAALAASSPTVRGAVAAPFKTAYGATGGNIKAFKVEANKLKTLRQEARALGFNPDTGKMIKGTKANPTLRMEYNIWNKAEGAELKRLESLQKAGTNVNQDRLKVLQSKRDKFKSDLSSNKQNISKAKKRLEAQKRIVADKKKLYRGRGFAPRGIPQGTFPAAMKGLTAGFVGEIAAMPTRMLFGDETQGQRVTNEAIETMGTQAGMRTGQVVMFKKIKNKIQKNGMAWALKRIAQKGGLKLALSVGGKAILGTAGGIISGGVLTGVSAALLAKDLYDIYNILAE